MCFSKMYIFGAPIESEGPGMVSYEFVKSPRFARAWWGLIHKGISIKYQWISTKLLNLHYYTLTLMNFPILSPFSTTRPSATRAKKPRQWTKRIFVKISFLILPPLKTICSVVFWKSLGNVSSRNIFWKNLITTFWNFGLVFIKNS